MVDQATVDRLKERVIHRARQLANCEPPISWKDALWSAATELLTDWDWQVNEFVSSKFENADFVLLQYRGDW